MTEEQKKVKRYVNAIERHLKFPMKVKARINSDIGTEIHMRLETGKTIDEVMAEMGKPKEVAERFNMELQEQTLRKHPLRFLFLALCILFVIGTVGGYFEGNMSFMQNHKAVSVIGGVNGQYFCICSRCFSRSLCRILDFCCRTVFRMCRGISVASLRKTGSSQRL